MTWKALYVLPFKNRVKTLHRGTDVLIVGVIGTCNVVARNLAAFTSQIQVSSWVPSYFVFVDRSIF